jgi:ligand-binding sensor domain-containing protein
MFTGMGSLGHQGYNMALKLLWIGFNFCLNFLRITSILAFLPAQLTLGSAQDSITPSHSQQIWDRAAGFPGGYVHSITQTADGYLWIGTSKGLVRYDGVTFVSIPEGDSSVDTKFAVVGLVTDSSDQLWATDDSTHLLRYSVGRLMGPLAGSVKRLRRASPVSRTLDGWLLFVNEAQGLVKYERGVARVLLNASAIPRWPTEVAQAADGTFWIGTRDDGVFHFEVTQGSHKVQQIAGLADTKINCLLTIGISTVLYGRA